MIYTQIKQTSYFINRDKEMRKRQSTITQQYSPTFRRRVKPNYLSLSLPGAIRIVEVERESPKHKEEETESRHSERIKQNYDKFVDNYQRIHSIIDQVDDIIRKRMEAHEEGLLTVVRSQIDKMQADCRKIVDEYNHMIETKNKETEIYNLKNQVQYFRHAALKYYEHNRKLVHQNKELRQLLMNKDSIIEDLNGAARKVTKKYLKEKAVGERKQKQQEEKTQMLWKKIHSLTHENFQNAPKNIREQVQKGKESPSIQKEKQKQPSLFSQRYSNAKTNMSSNMKNNTTKKRLQTQLASTSFKEDSSFLTLKVKNSGKSKSFWKFEGRT